MSEIRATTISDETGNGPIALTKQHAAKVWIRYYTSPSVTINGSFNVSSVVDNSVGSTIVNLVNGFNNTNNISNTGISNQFHQLDGVAPTTTALRYNTYNSSHAAADAGRNYGSAHGDLA